MNEEMSDLPQAIAADPDGVQVALRAAQTLWSRGDTAESLKWLRKAAESASDEGADMRSLQLAKAAAELRAKLFGGSEPPARSAFGGVSVASGPNPGAGGSGSSQGFGSFPPSDVAPGESGSHPIAQVSDLQANPRASSDSEPPRSVRSSSAPPIEAFVVGAGSEESAAAFSSRPVTATQYPSHRPRQRMGLLSASPPSTRESAAYASVPSWSADSERRGSGAPPPLPRANLDDYEELEAEPDDEPVDEPADDPGSVWSSAGPESWRPAEGHGSVSGQALGGPAARGGASARAAGPIAVSGAASSGSLAAGAKPPPLPPRGAFADDDSDFTHQTEAQTVMVPSHQEDADAEPRSVRESHSAPVAFGAQGNAWDQQSRVPSWDPAAGSSWATELHQATWGTSPNPENGETHEPLPPEVATQSEAARAKLTARVHHQAVRVSFAPDLRVPGQYVVRPLREGEKAATGERVALLVALEPGMPLV